MRNNQIKKNQEYIVDIIDNGFQGEGIAKINDYTVFIPNSIKGEIVKILIVKANKTYGYGKILEILENSKDRNLPICDTYKRCGGCNLQHMKYEKQLELKTEIVRNLVNKGLKEKVQVENTIGMDNPNNYRNKAKYALGVNKQGENVYGFFAQRSHDVILPKTCHIQNEKIDEVTKFVFEIINKYNLPVYNEETNEGAFRHIIVKLGIRTNEIMVIFVTTNIKFPNKDLIVNELISKYKDIKTIVQNINSNVTNTILGNKNICLYGDGYIKDKLGDYIFKISPLSFYQVNPIQTEVLYNKAIEFANLTGNETVYDLYSGIGTISIFISKAAKKVYGIEIVKEAVEDANENAKINNVKNVEFIAGEVEKVLPQMYKQGKMADVIFVDPPRKGLDEVTINTIFEIKPKRIVYISCNPATLVRDLNTLSDKYEVERIQPVDMFPFTSNVECVAVLYAKEIFSQDIFDGMSGKLLLEDSKVLNISKH